MWLTSRYFLIASLGVAASALVLAWSLSICITPTTTKWRILQALFIVACVLQMPVFLIFEAYPCSDYKPEQSCQFGIGSYLLMASIAGWVFTVFLTQCLDIPFDKNKRQRSASLERAHPTSPRSMLSEPSRSDSYEKSIARSGSRKRTSSPDAKPRDGSVNISDAFDLSNAYFFEKNEEKKEDQSAFDPFTMDDRNVPKATDESRNRVKAGNNPASLREIGLMSPIADSKAQEKSKPPLSAGIFRANSRPKVSRGYVALEGNTPPHSVASSDDKSIPFSPSQDSQHFVRDENEQILLQNWSALHQINDPVINVRDRNYVSDDDETPSIALNTLPEHMKTEKYPFSSIGSASSGTGNLIRDSSPNSNVLSAREHADSIVSPALPPMQKSNSVPNLAQYSTLKAQSHVPIDLGSGSGIHNIHQVENYRPSVPRTRSADSIEVSPTSSAHMRLITPKSTWRDEKSLRVGIHAQIDPSLSMSGSEVSDFAPPVSTQLRQARIQRMLRDYKTPSARSKSAEPSKRRALPPLARATTPPPPRSARRVHVVSPGDDGRVSASRETTHASVGDVMLISSIGRSMSTDNSSVSSMYTRPNAFRNQTLGSSFSLSFDNERDPKRTSTFNRLWEESESDAILNDLDVSLAHLRRPIEAEYGAEEVSL